LKRPSLSTQSGDIIYITHPPELAQMHAFKLEKSVEALLEEGHIEEDRVIVVVDKNIKSKIKVLLDLKN
jgi:hypothetical protein